MRIFCWTLPQKFDLAQTPALPVSSKYNCLKPIGLWNRRLQIRQKLSSLGHFLATPLSENAFDDQSPPGCWIGQQGPHTMNAHISHLIRLPQAGQEIVQPRLRRVATHLLQGFRRAQQTPVWSPPQPPEPTETDGICAISCVPQSAELDLQDVIADHQQWAARLRRCGLGVPGERLDAETACRPNCCALGHWLHRHSRLATVSAHDLDRLQQEHADFHAKAAVVVALIQAGAAESALQSVEHGDFAQVSQRLLRHLTALRDALIAQGSAD